MSIFSRILVLGLVASSGAGLLSCGSASNNDQGTSFTARGFFQDGSGTIGDVGTIVFMNDDVPGSQGVFPLIVPIDKDLTAAGVQGGFIGLDNHLTSQFIHTVRAECSYDVQGADPGFSIPSDSFPVTVTLDAAPVAGVAAATGASTPITRQFVQIEIVSPDIMQYLNVNQNLLPALPFRMTASCRVVGVTQAGDNLETNSVFYTIQFADRPECCTGATDPVEDPPGFQVGAGSGGTFNSIGGSASSSTTTTTA